MIGTLYGFEMRKLLKRKMVWLCGGVTLLLAAVTITGSLFGDYDVDGTWVDSNYHFFQEDRAHQMALDGRPIDQELLAETWEAYGKIPFTEEHYSSTPEYYEYAWPYSPIFHFVRNQGQMVTAEALAWKPEEGGLYELRMHTLRDTWEDSRLSQGEQDFWRKKEAELETPFVYRYKESYWSLFRGITSIGLFVLFGISVCLSNLFAEDHIRRTDQLILASVHGKHRLYWIKILAGVTFAAGFALAVSVFAFLTAFAAFGAEGFSGAVQLIFPDCSWPLSVGEAVLIAYGILVVSAMAVALFVMLLSEVWGSIPALAVTSAFLVFSMLFDIPASYRILSQIWDWFPTAILTPWNLFDVRLLRVGFGYLTSWQAAPVLYPLAGAAVVIAGKRIYGRN